MKFKYFQRKIHKIQNSRNATGFVKGFSPGKMVKFTWPVETFKAGHFGKVALIVRVGCVFYLAFVFAFVFLFVFVYMYHTTSDSQ